MFDIKKGIKVNYFELQKAILHEDLDNILKGEAVEHDNIRMSLHDLKNKINTFSEKYTVKEDVVKFKELLNNSIKKGILHIFVNNSEVSAINGIGVYGYLNNNIKYNFTVTTLQPGTQTYNVGTFMVSSNGKDFQVSNNCQIDKYNKFSNLIKELTPYYLKYQNIFESYLCNNHLQKYTSEFPVASGSYKGENGTRFNYSCYQLEGEKFDVDYKICSNSEKLNNYFNDQMELNFEDINKRIPVRYREMNLPKNMIEQIKR